jgi:hypothetical protein
VRRSYIVTLSLKEGCGNQIKNGKNKKNEGFPMNLNSQRVKMDLPMTQKTKPKKSKQENKTNQENNLIPSMVANFVIELIVKCGHKSIPLASLQN